MVWHLFRNGALQNQRYKTLRFLEGSVLSSYSIQSRNGHDMCLLTGQQVLYFQSSSRDRSTLKSKLEWYFISRAEVSFWRCF